MKNRGLGKLPRADQNQVPGHRGERCSACRQRFGELLRAAYGEVSVNHKLPGMGARLEDYKTSIHYDALARIHAALQDFRGHREFVRARTLPRCDYYVLKPGFVVELDESQHFTAPRRLALSLYPPDLALGFDRNRWMKMCKDIAEEDNDPVYRDEQRAWYETLRDFAPALLGLRPTVRIRRTDTKWCPMNVDRSTDVSMFRAVIEGRNG